MMTSESSERVSQRFGQLTVYSWYIVPASVISSILLLIAVAYPSQSKELGIAHLIGIAITAFVFGLIFCNCLSFLIKELNVYIDNVDAILSKGIKSVVYRLKVAYIMVSGACCMGGIVSMIFASSNFLFHLGTYLHLVVFTIAPPVSYMTVITVAGVSQSDNKQIVPTHSDKKIRFLDTKQTIPTFHKPSDELENKSDLSPVCTYSLAV